MKLIISFWKKILGFAGYFDATLYKDVHLGIEPSTATPNMFSWYIFLYAILFYDSQLVILYKHRVFSFGSDVTLLSGFLFFTPCVFLSV